MDNVRRAVVNASGAPAGGRMGLVAKVAGVGLALVGLASQSFYTVAGYERAVVFSRWSGLKDTVIPPGMHVKIPFIEYPTLYDVRARPTQFKTLTGSKDLQMIDISARILAKPDVRRLTWIHRAVGPDYDNVVLPSILSETLKAVIANFNASELITMRSDVSMLVAKRLRRRADDFGLLLDDVSITHLSFSSEYAHAVEQKKVAEQEAERAKIYVEKAMQEKESSIIRARGEAEAARLIGAAAAQGVGYLELMRLDAAREIATIIARSGNSVYLNSDSLLLNLSGGPQINVRANQE